eukprot:CAMPEP_0179976454 /NCGR_PEP_ID=MMETSP0983-20121128/39391_1 /TAXON_ID=483367 /ORGANISM="non described non described, Strain CCMP 2436" /LENGTH=117 /DNA_ID=CAMNT_0021893289 /DNA_START=235 /DNA_END=586 /DNA_ORIENTATION=-
MGSSLTVAHNLVKFDYIISQTVRQRADRDNNQRGQADSGQQSHRRAVRATATAAAPAAAATAAAATTFKKSADLLLSKRAAASTNFASAPSFPIFIGAGVPAPVLGAAFENVSKECA